MDEVGVERCQQLVHTGRSEVAASVRYSDPGNRVDQGSQVRHRRLHVELQKNRKADGVVDLESDFPPPNVHMLLTTLESAFPLRPRISVNLHIMGCEQETSATCVVASSGDLVQTGRLRK